MGRSKRKSRNHRPVSIKKKIKKNRKPHTGDPKVTSKWDIKKSLQANYAALGLSPGEKESAVNPKTQDTDQPKIEPDLTIPKDNGPSIKFLSESEMEVICELMLVYGDDFKAMTRDMKLNPFQLTKKQLKKKCEIFKARYEGTRYDPINKAYNQRLIQEQLKKLEEVEGNSD